MEKQEPAQILIADDHPTFLEGIGSIISPLGEYEVVAMVPDGKKALDYLKDHKVDLLITDVHMPDMDGVELTRYVKKRYSHTRILVLSIHSDRGTVIQLMQHGIDGFLTKDARKEQILEAIENVLDGNAFFSESIQQAFFKYTSSETETYTQVELSKREIEILKLLSQEYTTQEIADALFISPLTVNTHRKNMLRKLDARNTIGLVKYAIKNGLLDA